MISNELPANFHEVSARSGQLQQEFGKDESGRRWSRVAGRDGPTNSGEVPANSDDGLERYV